MPHILANGIQLYYELHGPENADVLVLSNGILMSTASWAMQTPQLSRFFRVLLYDARGMWQSEHPEDLYSMGQHADDLAALLQALNIPKAHIAGISYGGEISLIFAYRYPHMTQSLIVSSSVSEIDDAMRERVAPWIQAARNKDPDLLFEATAPMNFSPEWMAANQPLLAAARARYASLDFDSFLRLMDSFSQLDVTGDLHQIQAPALVMVGEKDILKPRSYAEKISAQIPQAELAVLPGAAHAANWERPGLWNTLVLGFADKHATQ